MEKIRDLEELKNRLVEMLVNGVEVDANKFRKMDLIDYFEMTDIDPKNISKVLSAEITLTPSERRIIGSFGGKYSYAGDSLSKEQLERKIANEKVTIKGIEITDDIKSEEINFLEESGISFSYLNYQAYIRRVADMLSSEMKRD